MANKRKTYKEQVEEKYGKKKKDINLQEAVDSWLDRKVNQPLAKKGFDKLGAGISAVGSAAGEFIPESGIEVLLGGVGKVGKKAGKGALKWFKGSKATDKTKEVPTVKYSDLKTPTDYKKAGPELREKFNKEKAQTIVYDTGGDAIVKQRQKYNKKPKVKK